jgi:glycosyltransferase involved in cell wall biosynthesis
MKRIDVILPFHRDDLHLRRAINSVIQSTNVNLRLILIDDRLNQDSKISLEITKGISVAFAHTKGGQGYGAALKKGSEFIDSDFVALMNSDDLVHHERFRIQQESIAGYDLNFTSLIRQNARGQYSKSITGELSYGEFDTSFLFLGAYGANASWFMTREWWFENSFFDDQAALDWRIALSSFQHSRVKYLHKPLYFYTRHKMQSTSRSTTPAQFDVIYEKWAEMHDATLGGRPSRNIFDLIATPWITTKCNSWPELSSWIENFQSNSQSLSSGVSMQASHLLRRRLALMGLRNFSNFLEMPTSYKKFLPCETWKITKDLVARSNELDVAI